MGQSISYFGVIIPSLGNPPLGEEEKRRINASLDQACNFSERVERIIPSPTPHHETISAHLPHLSNPWPDGYHSLAQIVGPIDEIPFQGNPGQNDNPIVSHPGSVTRPPLPVMVGGESINQVMSAHFNTWGKPSARVMSSVSGIISSC